MRYCLCLLFIISLLTGCKDNDEGPAERNWKMFQLYVDKGNNLEVFQKARFRLRDENRDYFKIAATNPYDSVIWKLSGTPHHMRFTLSNYDPTYMGGGFEYLFSKVGEYKSILQWYHNGELVGADTFNITVSDTMPFLGHDYSKEVTENIEDPFDSNVCYTFMLRKSDLDTGPGQGGLVNIFQMSVYFMESPINLDDAYFQQQRRNLVSYFTKAYGSPMYTEEKDDINKLFYEKFGIDNDIYQKYAVGSYYQSIYPEMMWQSPTSDIALVRIHFTAEEWVINSWDPDGYPRPVHDEYVIWAKERQK